MAFHLTNPVFDSEDRLVAYDNGRGTHAIWVNTEEYGLNDWWKIVSRPISGALILGTFFPGVGAAIGAATGLVSAFWNKIDGVGYYSKEGKLQQSGTFHKDDLTLVREPSGLTYYKCE